MTDEREGRPVLVRVIEDWFLVGDKCRSMQLNRQVGPLLCEVLLGSAQLSKCSTYDQVLALRSR